MKTTLKTLARALRELVGGLLSRGYSAVSRTPIGLRVLIPVVLLAAMVAGIAVADGWRPMRKSDLYPLRWQDATSLPAHTASFAFAPSAPTIGYTCAATTLPPLMHRRLRHQP